MISSDMNNVKEDLGISLVWERAAVPQATAYLFPTNVLNNLKSNFSISVHHRSNVYPLVLASVPSEQYANLEQFVSDVYGAQLELGKFD